MDGFTYLPMIEDDAQWTVIAVNGSGMAFTYARLGHSWNSKEDAQWLADVLNSVEDPEAPEVVLDAA